MFSNNVIKTVFGILLYILCVPFPCNSYATSKENFPAVKQRLYLHNIIWIYNVVCYLSNILMKCCKLWTGNNFIVHVIILGKSSMVLNRTTNIDGFGFRILNEPEIIHKYLPKILEKLEAKVYAIFYYLNLLITKKIRGRILLIYNADVEVSNCLFLY